MPPLRLRDERLAPMMVRMNEANDMAMRLWNSTSYCTTFCEPRSCCFEMYCSSSGDVNVSCCPFEKTRSMGSIMMSVSSVAPVVISSRRPFSVRIL